MQTKMGCVFEMKLTALVGIFSISVKIREETRRTCRVLV
jgi:hypothetical protein